MGNIEEEVREALVNFGTSGYSKCPECRSENAVETFSMTNEDIEDVHLQNWAFDRCYICGYRSDYYRI